MSPGLRGANLANEIINEDDEFVQQHGYKGSAKIPREGSI
jgi:hypothetical protein